MAHRKVQIWPGFTTSIRQYEYDILLNSKIINKIMREETVYQVIRDCTNHGKDYRERVMKLIIGTTVLTDYCKDKTYKVSDINWNLNPQSTFDMQGHKESYANYFKNKYGLIIRDMKQPMLVVKPTAKNIRGGKGQIINLIPELCRLTGINDDMRRDHSFTREMAEKTRLDPRQTYDRVKSNIQRLSREERACSVLNMNRMTISDEPATVKATVLMKEVLLFGGGKQVPLTDSEWTQHLETNKMYKTMQLTNWHFVYPREEESTRDDFLRIFKDVATRLSMPLDPPNIHEVKNEKSSYIGTLEKIMRRDPLIIIVLVSARSVPDLYKVIKITTLSGSRPVPVQVVNAKTWNEKQAQILSIATKIVVQVNCKVGGIPWKVDLKLSGLLIVGFDVSHDLRNKKKSYGAMVASLNPNAENGGYFFSAVDKHENGGQLSVKLSDNIVKAIKVYAERNGNCLPKRILIYRDGVGDGQVSF